eukprot:Gregarina_sp_Poly_1__195@NODE_1045_length_5261_cov_14_130920_g725_i0_p1_GENE_NODE_1045_length_5261_cov_14_130920_g725_i0NODE_1045_length_5261_cov_14_130920_g725_i0_p1_ORF_typecomplete_len616_score93_26Pkinase/PF00069_25/9e57Pkinase_Tyr/PF07714_17/5_4e31Kinaselike/PF14531_6/2_1e12RIO1/PF01163_22/4_9e06Kdo/PF06293_14/2_1e05Pkinase_fungal/PF17667_1/1_6e05YrbLPhoP_reg/PF10707_9/0_00095APH/PF01636_23/2_8e03APH/PF01636_23/0_0052Pox_serthr_kin/PF05445_11/0_0093WaaY/PF06176_11/0_029FTA2/PF13095_6/0_099P
MNDIDSALAPAMASLDHLQTPTQSFGVVDDEVTSDDENILSAHHKHPAALCPSDEEAVEALDGSEELLKSVDDGDSTPPRSSSSISGARGDDDEERFRCTTDSRAMDSTSTVALPEHLRLLQERIASEKKRLRQFIIATKERREKEEQAAGGEASGGLASTDVTRLSPGGGECRPSGSAATAGPIMAVTDEVEEENGDEEDDDFDMFNPDDAASKKRKRAGAGVRLGAVSGTSHSKRLAIDPTLRAVDAYDDAEGYYLATINEILHERYRVASQSIGKGVFSAVYRCIDQKAAQPSAVAIKIVRRNDLMRKAGEKEMEILKLLNSDPKHHRHIVVLKDVFMHRHHLCLVFENLSLDMRQFMKRRGSGKDKGLNLLAIAFFARQLMVALRHMRKHRIIHADIKPDNILLDERHNTLKVCDLGSAFDVSENEVTAYLVSRYYRAPEIILGCRYDYAIDMWSMACTLFEIATGNFLFTGRNNSELLHDIMITRGRFSNKLLRSAKFASDYFCEDLIDFKLRTIDWNQRRVTKIVSISPKPTKSIQDRLNSELPPLHNTTPTKTADYKQRVKNFTDFLDRGLCLDPARRLTPDEALRHPFLTQGLSSSSRQGSRNNGQI